MQSLYSAWDDEEKIDCWVQDPSRQLVLGDALQQRVDRFPKFKGNRGCLRKQQKNKVCLTPCGVWLSEPCLSCPERTGD